MIRLELTHEELKQLRDAAAFAGVPEPLYQKIQAYCALYLKNEVQKLPEIPFSKE